MYLALSHNRGTWSRIWVPDCRTAADSMRRNQRWLTSTSAESEVRDNKTGRVAATPSAGFAETAAEKRSKRGGPREQGTGEGAPGEGWSNQTRNTISSGGGGRQADPLASKRRAN